MALTKTDLVEPDWLELVRDDVRALLAGTFLAGCPIVPVSSKTGAGLPELRAALAELARAVPAKAPDRTARLPIDRVFTVKGFGTVVTGTLTAGRFAVDDRVEVYPRGLQSKVRGPAGARPHGPRARRPASAPRSISRAWSGRPSSAATCWRPPAPLVPTLLLDGTLELLDDAPRPLKTRDRVRFHVGTQEVMARVLLVGEPELAPGPRLFGRFRLEAPVVALPGDRFVIRSYSPIVTIGGGTAARHRAAALQAQGARARRPPRAARHGRAGRGGGGAPAARPGPRARGWRISAPARRSAPSSSARCSTGSSRRAPSSRSIASGISTATRTIGCAPQTLGLLEAFHAENPLRGGISREELRSRAGNAQERVFTQLLTALEAEGVVASERDQVRLASHAIRLSPDQQRVVNGARGRLPRAPAPRRRAPRRPWAGWASRARRSTSSSRSWSPTGRWCA